MKKFRHISCILIVLFYSNLFSGLPFDTKVFLSDGTTRNIQDIGIKNKVLSYFPGNQETEKYISSSRVILNEKCKLKKLYAIQTESGIFCVAPEQKVFNAHTKQFVMAHELTINDSVLNAEQQEISIKKIKVLNLDTTIDSYHLTILAPHAFFILDSNGGTVLVHNSIVLTLVIAAPKIYTVACWTYAGITIGYGICKEFELIEKLGSVLGDLGKWINKKIFKKKRKIAAEAEANDPVNKLVNDLFKDLNLKDMEGETSLELDDDGKLNILGAGSKKIYEFPSDKTNDFLDKLANLARDKRKGFGVFVPPSGGTSGGAGGPEDPDKLFEKFKKFLKNKNALPHIFSDKGGHIKNMTEENLRRFVDTVKPENFIGINENGNGVYKKVVGTLGEIWVYTRDGKIFDAGLNVKPGIEGFLEVLSEIGKKLQQKG